MREDRRAHPTYGVRVTGVWYGGTGCRSHLPFHAPTRNHRLGHSDATPQPTHQPSFLGVARRLGPCCGQPKPSGPVRSPWLRPIGPPCAPYSGCNSAYLIWDTLRCQCQTRRIKCPLFSSVWSIVHQPPLHRTPPLWLTHVM
jgi:hypothetical protein